MRFLKSTMLAVAAASVMSVPAAAQTPAPVTVNISNSASDWVAQATPAGYSLTGGGWRATVTGIPGTLAVPKDLIVYCFDSKRQFEYNKDMDYTLLSFKDFITNAGVTDGTRSAQWDQISILDLNYMVEQVSGYDKTNAVTPNNNTRQANVWTTSNNGGVNASPFNTDQNAYSGSWMILVDRNEWANGTGNPIRGRQSFLVEIGGGARIPEPASFSLVAAGMAALAMAARRRRNTLS